MGFGLKEYLDLLEENDELVSVSKEVDPRYEASAVIKKRYPFRWPNFVVGS